MANNTGKSGNGLDTGTGGFPVDPSNDRLTYDVGVPDAGQSPLRSKWNSGQIKVDNTQRDLSMPTRQTLAAYLSKTSLGQTKASPSPTPNKYPILHGDNEDLTKNLKLYDEKGYPQILTPTVGAVEEFPHYVDVVPGDDRTPASSELKILRGRQQPTFSTTVDGNDLLRVSVLPLAGAPVPPPRMQDGVGGVNTTEIDPDGPIAKYSPAATTQGNDFSPDQEYLDDADARDAATTKTLAAYHSDTTHGQTESASSQVSNTYPVTLDPNTVPSELTLLDEKGYPQFLTPLSEDPRGFDAFPHYVDTTPGDSRSAASKDLDMLRGRQEPYRNAQNEMVKIDGNRLLSTAAEPRPGLPVPPPRMKDGVGGVNVSKINPFNPLSKYSPTATTQGNDFSPEQEYSDDASGRDVTTTQTSATYLSETTLGQTESSPSQISNKYPISHEEASLPVELSLKDEKGYPHPLTSIQASQPQQPHYTNSTPGDSRSTASKDLKILRGRQESTADTKVDGNELLLKSTIPFRGGVQVPPPRMKDGVGGVNVALLNPVSPLADYIPTATSQGNVFTYTEKFLDKNENPQQKEPLSLKDLQYPTDVLAADIPLVSKKTLADYLTNTTAKNRYSVDVDKNAAPISLQNDPKLTNLLFSNQDHFADTTPGDSRTVRVDPSKIDGNNLLHEIQGDSRLGNFIPPVESLVLDEKGSGLQYSKSILNFNRFNVENDFQSAASDIKSKLFNSPSRYEYGKSPLASEERNFSFGRLAKVGTTLSARSGLEIGSTDRNYNPSEGIAGLNAIFPGNAQLGLKRIGRGTLNASDVLDDITKSNLGEEQIINPAADSWGTMNNVLDQYSGIGSFGMQLLAIALITAFVLIVELLIGVIAFLNNIPFLKSSEKGAFVNEDKLKRLPYGAFHADMQKADYSSVAGILNSFQQGTFNFWNAIGLTNVENEILLAIPMGTLIFFGGYEGQETASIADLFEIGFSKSVLQSAGYYSVIARSVNRSFLRIGDSFSKLGDSFKTGIVAGFQALAGIIETFRSSQFMHSLNIFAKIGDRALSYWTLKESRLKKDSDAIGAGVKYKSDIDNNLNIDAAYKSRLLVNKKDLISPLTLAWASYRSPDLFVMPATVAGLLHPFNQAKLGMPKYSPTVASDGQGGKSGGLPNDGVYNVVDMSSTRIDPAVVTQFEDSLEAEYLPFYFHDIRTNEIVSFHAFLASLGESYTAAYDSSEAFGRVEPIKIYKGTHRKIDFSFYIAATSPKDFDSMWLKINKLTTLLYPQFTEGRMLLSGDYQMQAPFSQTIKASPLIRLRIGDLIRTNYSKFNLAKLFGYTHPNTKFGANAELKIKTAADAEEQIKKLNTSLIDAVYKEGNTFKTTSNLRNYYADDKGSTSKVKTPPSPFNILPDGMLLKFVKFGSGDTDSQKIICKVVVADGNDIADFPSGLVDANYLTLLYGGGNGPQYHILEKSFVFDKNELIPTKSTLKKAADAAAAADPYTDGLEQLMQNNAISRSFKSVGGKGLPGFIETMSFDWYDKVTWEIGHGVQSPAPAIGRRAPKICKVTISFSPTHDITPGLDNLGMNRAPLYPVGPLSVDNRSFKIEETT